MLIGWTSASMSCVMRIWSKAAKSPPPPSPPPPLAQAPKRATRRAAPRDRIACGFDIAYLGMEEMDVSRPERRAGGFRRPAPEGGGSGHPAYRGHGGTTWRRWQPGRGSAGG